LIDCSAAEFKQIMTAIAESATSAEIPWIPKDRLDGGIALDDRSSRIDVVIVTATHWPNGSGDDRRWLMELRHVTRAQALTPPLTFDVVCWDDKSFDWSRARLIVIRSVSLPFPSP
jgi:hypothetical protein